MITAVKVAVQARSEGFLVLHHVLGLAAARSEYNAGARQDGAPSPGVTPWIKFVAGACQPLPRLILMSQGETCGSRIWLELEFCCASRNALSS